MKCDVLAIGPLSLDAEETRYDGKRREYVGGALPFTVRAELVAGREVCVVVKSAPEDFDKLADMPVKKLYCVPSSITMHAEAIYYTEDKECRDILVHCQGESITIADIPEVDAAIYQMAGVYYGDFDDALFTQLSRRGKLACDMQGYVRYAENKEIVFHDWADKKTYLPYLTYVKTDAREAQILTGTDDREKAARMIADWGAREVMVTHNTEVIVYAEGQIFSYPLRPRSLEGRAGRGDTTFGSYITERIDKDPQQSLLYAAAAVSLKMESPAPFAVPRAEVEAYMQERYADFL